MKLLQKITLGTVTLLSLCSCGKGTKTTEEDFLEKVNAIEENDPYTEAEMIYYFTSSIKEAGKDKVVEDNRYTASFAKKKGNWVNDRIYSDKEAVTWFNSCVVDSSPAQFVNLDMNGFVLDRNDVKYYVDPFGVEYEYKRESNFFGIKYVSSFYLYYEWDQYGYITSARSKTAEKDNTGEYNILFTQNIKITYR